MIGTKDGIVNTRTIRRKGSPAHIWDRGKLCQVHSTPWNASGEEIRDEDIKLEVPGQEEEVKNVPALEEEERGRMRFYINIKDIA